MIPTIPEPDKNEDKPKKEQKILDLVTCDKCNRKMTAKTLKYSHSSICPINNPKETIDKPKKISKLVEDYIQKEQIEEQQLIINTYENQLNMRQKRINQRKDQFKNLLVNAF